MFTNIFLLFSLVVSGFFLSSACANTPVNINGIWMLDTDATKDSLMVSPPGKENVDEFVMQAVYALAYVYEFDGENLTGSVLTLRGPLYDVKYLLLFHQDDKILYVSVKGTPVEDCETLTVYVLDDLNIKIISDRGSQSANLLWKRADKSQLQTRSEETQGWYDWIALLENISEAIKSKSDSRQ